MSLERTLVIVKPDGMQKNLTGIILQRFTKAGMRPIASKMMQLTEAILRDHYDFLVDKPFFPDILSYMQQCPVMLWVLEGENAIARIRELHGKTNPAEAADGTIRKLYATNGRRNAVHASDSPESAAREIHIFFNETEILDGEYHVME